MGPSQRPERALGVSSRRQPGFAWEPEVTSQSGCFEFRPGFMSRSGRQRGQDPALPEPGAAGEEGAVLMECLFLPNVTLGKEFGAE